MLCVLGIDTSNYTTSLCAIRLDDGKMVAESRKLLPVQIGQRGLRQSDALFFHVQQLPLVMNDLMSQFDSETSSSVAWCGVGVSVRPRPLAASYMPVFQAGSSFAFSFARALGIPVVRTSHQEGHLAAAQYFLSIPLNAPFLAVHLSGGTSDILLATPNRFGYSVLSIAEGADLHAGQFVDRVGVALKCPFPAGPHLEQLARQAAADSAFRLASSGTGVRLSFSGPCSAALRAIDKGISAAEVAFAVEACIANSVVNAVRIALQSQPTVKYLVVAGGVAANQHIENRVKQRLRIVASQVEVTFAPTRYASDNALGPASIARKYLCDDAAF